MSTAQQQRQNNLILTICEHCLPERQNVRFYSRQVKAQQMRTAQQQRQNNNLILTISEYCTATKTECPFYSHQVKAQQIFLEGEAVGLPPRPGEDHALSVGQQDSILGSWMAWPVLGCVASFRMHGQF